MLIELAVSDLGVIDHLRLDLGPGMTALTGETGAGKTMLVEAIELLMGSRADPHLVRAGAKEAVIEGRFDADGEELVLTRVVAAEGRSRAYLNGRMATAAVLAEVGTRLVDLHGQHDHQSLLSGPVQRDALDRFAGVDLAPLLAARADLHEIDRHLSELGGDAGARARELDLLRYQATELHAADLSDPAEDVGLDAEEDVLGDAVAHREVAAAVVAALADEGGATERLGMAIASLEGRAPFSAETDRLHALAAELADVVAVVRATGEQIEDDPARLDQIRDRRQMLSDLRRKYGTASLDDEPGDGTLAAVLAYRDALSARIDDLEGFESAAAGLETRRRKAVSVVTRIESSVGSQRRKAAPKLARAVTAHLGELAMAGARVDVEVGARDPGDEVRFLLAANVGSEALPLARTASGGELARAMLALRLVLSAAPPTLVFDEVDAGIGGAAALAVGRALAALGADHQVLVVTHLPQVAAFADVQVQVSKTSSGGRTTSEAHRLDAADRVVELSRMLSGTPESARAQEHAAELLASAAATRGR